jgi:hypothetical protein
MGFAGLLISRNHSYHLSKNHGFLGAYFLATETSDTSIGIHLGEVVIHGQSRYRTLLDADATACAQFRISLRSQERSIMNHRLHGLVAENRLAT